MLLKVWLFLFSIHGQITSWIARSFDEGILFTYLAILALFIVVFMLRRALYNLNNMRNRFDNIYEEELKKKAMNKSTDADLPVADEMLQKLNKLQEIIPKIGNINTAQNGKRE